MRLGSATSADVVLLPGKVMGEISSGGSVG